jgi:hypothetical protein
VLVRKVAHTLEVARLRHVCVDRLHHYDGDLLGEAFEELAERVEVVVGKRVDELLQRARKPLDAGQRARVPLMEAVEAVLQDDLPSGVGARHADRRIDGVGAVLAEGDLFGAGDQLADPLRHLDLDRMHQRHQRTCGELLRDRLFDLAAAVAEDDRSEPVHPVDV